ncbi:DnaJ domain-containing protein [Archangium gephyra]|uniref:DnaJ domain-containing protein n=1 Tax=Archangium gephyra TaxID=48 RepID=UPI003B7E04B2
MLRRPSPPPRRLLPWPPPPRRRRPWLPPPRRLLPWPPPPNRPRLPPPRPRRPAPRLRVSPRRAPFPRSPRPVRRLRPPPPLRSPPPRRSPPRLLLPPRPRLLARRRPPPPPLPRRNRPLPPRLPLPRRPRAPRRAPARFPRSGKLAAKLKEQNHFERLNLGADTNGPAVKIAYFKLAKQYHPDTLPPGAPPELEKLKADIFGYIGDAYRALSDDKARAAYIEELQDWRQQAVAGGRGGHPQERGALPQGRPLHQGPQVRRRRQAARRGHPAQPRGARVLRLARLRPLLHLRGQEGGLQRGLQGHPVSV